MACCLSSRTINIKKVPLHKLSRSVMYAAACRFDLPSVITLLPRDNHAIIQLRILSKMMLSDEAAIRNECLCIVSVSAALTQ